MLNSKTRNTQRPRPQPYPAPIQGYQLSATSTTGKAPVCNRLLELVIQRENLSVVRLVWFILARTAPAYDSAQFPATMLPTGSPAQPNQPQQPHQEPTPPKWGEVEVSYSELQRTLGLSRCAVHTGLNRAIEAGYVRRTTEGSTTQRPARYAPNFALVTPNPPPPPGSNPSGGGGFCSSELTPSTSPRPGQDHAATSDRLTTIPGPDPAASAAHVPTPSSPNPGPSAQEEPGSQSTPSPTEHDKHGSAASPDDHICPTNWSENHQTKATVTPTPALSVKSSATASQPKFPFTTGIKTIENQTSNPTTTCSSCHLVLNSAHTADPGSSGNNSPIPTYPSDFQTGSLNVYELSLHDSILESHVESSRNLEYLDAPTEPVCNPYQSCQHHPHQPQHHATPGSDHAAGNPTADILTPATPTTATSTPTNPYLTKLSEELSRELGDQTHHRSNRTQLLNLWHKSGLSPDEFAQVVYHSRELTHRYATLRPGEKLPGNGQPRNKMAYFFRVVRDKLFGTGQDATALALAFAVGSNTVTTTQPQPAATDQPPQHGQSAPVVTPTPASCVTLTASQQRLIPQPTKSLNSTTTPSPTSAGTQTLRIHPSPSPLDPAAAPSSCSTPLPTFAGTKTPYQPRFGYGQHEHDNHRAMSASPGNPTGPGSASQPQRPRLSHQSQPPAHQPKPKPTLTGPGQPPRYHERGYSFDRPASPIPESWRRLMGGGTRSSGSGWASSSNSSSRAAPAT